MFIPQEMAMELFQGYIYLIFCLQLEHGCRAGDDHKTSQNASSSVHHQKCAVVWPCMATYGVQLGEVVFQQFILCVSSGKLGACFLTRQCCFQTYPIYAKCRPAAFVIQLMDMFLCVVEGNEESSICWLECVRSICAGMHGDHVNLPRW